MPTPQSLTDVAQTIRSDYARHDGARNLAFWAVAVYRYGRWAAGVPGTVGWLANKIYGGLFFGVEVTTGIRFNREAEVGESFHLVHSGNTAIHPGVVIGKRCGVMHDVTIGTSMDKPGVPRIGDDVFIGAGAKVLGPITIGDGARIAANSLVISDVPAGALAVGVPARVIPAAMRPTEGKPSPTP